MRKNMSECIFESLYKDKANEDTISREFKELESSQVNLEEEVPTAEDLQNDDKAIAQGKIKTIEDEIGNLKAALQDNQMDDTEKQAINKKITDLESQENDLKNKLNSSSSQSTVNNQ